MVEAYFPAPVNRSRAAREWRRSFRNGNRESFDPARERPKTQADLRYKSPEGPALNRGRVRTTSILTGKLRVVLDTISEILANGGACTPDINIRIFGNVSSPKNDLINAFHLNLLRHMSGSSTSPPFGLVYQP